MPLAILFALVLACTSTATRAATTCDLAKVRACYEDIMDSVPLFFASRAQGGDAAATFCSHYWEFSSCSSKAETKACRGEELVDRLERFYREVSAELCDDPHRRLLKTHVLAGPVDPFLEECPFQLHEMCFTQTLDVVRASLLFYGRPNRNLSRFYEELCGTEPAPCRPEDSQDKCTPEQTGTMHRFHLATAAMQQTLCAAPPALLANLTATNSCWDEKVFRECVLGDVAKPLARHLMGIARTGEQCRLLRSSWSACLEQSYSRLRRCEETPDVQGARRLLFDFLDRLQPCD